MTDDRLVLVGAGGHAQSSIDVIERAGWNIAGLVGLPEELGQTVLGHLVIGTDDDLPALVREHRSALVTIGQIDDPARRMAAFERLSKVGFQCPAVTAPDAEVSRHAKIGAGTIVMHGAIVNAGAVIGRNCIINSRALIEHGARIADHCHISTGAILNGGVRVGEGSFIGSGAVLKQGLTLGRRVVVGMGLSLRYDLDDEARYTGREGS